jgi:hypothetical protein
MQLYRYFVSQSSDFYCHNPLCCFSTIVYCCCLFRYRISPETFGYTLVCWISSYGQITKRDTSAWCLCRGLTNFHREKWHVVCYCTRKILVGKAEEKGPLGRLRWGWEDDIKTDLKEDVRVWTGYSWLRMESSDRLLWTRNEFLDKLSGHQLLNKNSFHVDISLDRQVSQKLWWNFGL